MTVSGRVVVAFVLAVGLLGCGGDGDDAVVEDGRVPADTEERAEVVDELLGDHRPDPVDEDLRAARAFYESIPLPADPLPRSLVGLSRLEAHCLEHFGYPTTYPEQAFVTGQFAYYVGEQTERFDEISSACEIALYDLGVLMGTGREANERLYDIYLESQACLADNGYPTVEPPTRESFIENPWGWYPWHALLPYGHGFAPSPEWEDSEEFGPYIRSLEVCPRP